MFCPELFLTSRRATRSFGIRFILLFTAAIVVGLCEPGEGAYIDEVLNDGPHGYWRLDEAAGTNAENSGLAGDSLNGAYGGGYTLGVPGALAKDPNTAVKFDGNDGIVLIEDAVHPTAYTIESWVKPATIRGQSIFLRTAGNPNSTWSHQIRMTQTGTFQAYAFDGNTRSVTGSTIATPGEWYHVVATARNDGLMRLYVNGAAEGGTTPLDTLWEGGSEYLIGSDSGDGASAGTIRFFDGTIDETALYLTELSSERIQAHYAAGIVPEPGSAALFLTSITLLLLMCRPHTFLR